MLLAGDVGGTKTLLGLFERAASRGRVRTASTATRPRRSHSFTDILDAFARDVQQPAHGRRGRARRRRSGGRQPRELTNVDLDDRRRRGRRAARARGASVC